MRHQREMPLHIQDDTAPATQGLVSMEQRSLGTHQLSRTSAVKHPCLTSCHSTCFPDSLASQQVEVDSKHRMLQSPVDKDPSLGAVRGFLLHPRTQGFHQACWPLFKGDDPEKGAGRSLTSTIKTSSYCSRKLGSRCKKQSFLKNEALSWQSETGLHNSF